MLSIRPRDGTRLKLLCLKRHTGHVSHHRFNELGGFLEPGDVLVVNDTAVIPGRLIGKKESGGKVEVLISDYAGGRKSQSHAGRFICNCLVRASKRPIPGTWFVFSRRFESPGA